MSFWLVYCVCAFIGLCLTPVVNNLLFRQLPDTSMLSIYVIGILATTVVLAIVYRLSRPLRSSRHKWSVAAAAGLFAFAPAFLLAFLLGGC